MPRVRIILPTYNRADLVTEAIASALAQSFHDFEVFVADDGSTDHTPQVLERLAARDSRVRPLRVPHGGAAAARNAAIRAAGDYEFAAFLDSDDIWVPDHLQGCVGLLQLHPDVALVSTAVEVNDHSGKWNEAWQREREDRMRRPIGCAARSLDGGIHILDPERCWRAMLSSEFTLQPTTVVARRAAVPRADWFDSGLKIFEDPELWLFLARNGRTFAYIDKVHARIRHFGDNLTGTPEELGSTKAFERYRSVLRFAHTKLDMCRNADERRIAAGEIAWTAYLLGQSCTERGELRQAREYYVQALRHQFNFPFLKGYLASWLPAPIFTRLRRLRTNAQYSKNS